MASSRRLSALARLTVVWETGDGRRETGDGQEPSHTVAGYPLAVGLCPCWCCLTAAAHPAPCCHRALAAASVDALSNHLVCVYT